MARELARDRAAPLRRVPRARGRLRTESGHRACQGILIERHGIEERAAFELLRRHARANNEKLVAVAQALANGTLQLG
ncbi:MAG: ANTAR domain-containing protein [Actinobacteria bacterium]|nr:ANTAR domain-containing protein [Actinomycetota bacterium]